jgi:NAD(P)-dependent dehydrogenase (short-subunit alcohol dehydrogenase family)
LSPEGAPLAATYAATKGFVQNFDERLAPELGTKSVSILSIAPAQVGTGFAARVGMQMGKAATPDTIAKGAPETHIRSCGIQPAHQSLFTDVFRPRALLWEPKIQKTLWRLQRAEIILEKRHQSVSWLPPSGSHPDRFF